MKKVLALMLALAMVFAFAACNGGKTATQHEVGGQVVVGSVTDLDANMLDGWTNGGQNASIRNLIFGGTPIAYTKEGEFAVDEFVAKSVESKENEDGTKTFTIKLRDDLKWNDAEKDENGKVTKEATAITAKDYVFSILFHTSPEYYALDAEDTATYGNCYVGYKEFHDGKTKTFKGVRLIDDHTFSVTVAAEELPFHFDIAYASVAPLPMHVIAPEVTLTDSEDGVTISDNYTASLLETTVNANDGYRYMPKVTYGPYQLDSYDDSTKQAVLVINSNFLGMYDGQKPSIQKIICKTVTNETQMDELAAGTVDLISGVSGGDSINAGLDVCEEGKAEYASYDRAGYGKIAFCCDFGPTQFAAVRQAIAYCLDREEFAKQYSGGYAKVVNGMYGLSTPEYKKNKDTINKELNSYSKDLEKAKQLLIDDGWTLNKNGGQFVEGTDDVRYKNVDGELMACEINWANTPNNPVSDLLNTMLPGEMAKVGMKLNSTTVEFGVLLNNMYRIGIDKPTYNMFNLATGFVPISSIWYEYSNDPAYMGSWNTNFIDDEELATIAANMKKIPYENEKEWEKAWVSFQKRWNEMLPDIPLYSDEYHDFYSTKIKGYEPDSLWQWESAIVYSYIEKADQ